MIRPETDMSVSLEERPPTGGGVAALAGVLAPAKTSTADPSPAEQAILAKLDEALVRTEEGRLRVAMLGQFKRGKSTLLNALLGVPLLPTGITPVTAIPTYVHVASAPSLRIEFEGSRKPLESLDAVEFPAILTQYVAEVHECEKPGAGPQCRDRGRFRNLQRPGDPRRHAGRWIDFSSQFARGGGRPKRLRRRHIRPLAGSSDHRGRAWVSRRRPACGAQAVLRPQQGRPLVLGRARHCHVVPGERARREARTGHAPRIFPVSAKAGLAGQASGRRSRARGKRGARTRAGSRERVGERRAGDRVRDGPLAGDFACEAASLPPPARTQGSSPRPSRI